MTFPWFCLATAKTWNGGPVLQLGYSSQFYSASKGRFTLKEWGRSSPKESPQSIWASLSISSPLCLACANWASQEGVCLLHLKFSLRSVYFLLFHFHWIFPFFIFWLQPFWTPFSYSNYLTGLYTVEVSIHPTSITCSNSSFRKKVSTKKKYAQPKS